MNTQFKPSSLHQFKPSALKIDRPIRPQAKLQSSPGNGIRGGHQKDKVRSTQLDNISSPNKENQHLNSNQQREWLSPVSPLHIHSPCHSTLNFQSPARTTPLENLSYLRSNKGKESIQEDSSSKVLFSGVSKDGKYRVESHSLQGQDLAKACDYERKMSLAAIMQSRREGNDQIPVLQKSKTSKKQNGLLMSYAVNTHQGISRNYNEDRVSITLNIKKQGSRAHFFAIYDGHGGHLCCDFLKEELHQRLINNSYFPSEPKKALAQTISQVENLFLEKAMQNQKCPDKSGSCLLATLLVDDLCFIANVGDSRAIMSTDNGKMAFNLSRDHRPSDIREQERILSKGGRIYRTEMVRPGIESDPRDKIVGPLRIFPGKLSVSRTIGDIEAKQTSLGGVQGVVSSQPDIRKFRLTGKEDFIVMCCDGVLERLESMEVVEAIWETMGQGEDMHQKTGRAVDTLLRESMRRKSGDNLTAILICFRQLRQQSFCSPNKKR